MSNTASDVTDIPKDTTDAGSEEFLAGYYAAEDGFFGEEEIQEEGELVLRSEDFISGPYITYDGTLPENILEFDFSYGYDCKKFYNIVVADENTVMFVSGNLINFFDVPTRSLTFRRSAFGGGLGHMTKNPNEEFSHIAIAENGEHPPIIVYEWPSLDIVCILRGGTSKCYNHLNYSPNGELLVSQGGEPDHLITVWNWPKSKILLRTKSYVSDVFRVFFSPYVPGQLTTCGLSHIKFWKMAKTFTGLKLQGELGRFGKTEYSDILGIYPMPDEKVISGCSWGNVLIWEEGLIKLEVFRKLRKNCHEGPIVQFDFKDGELWTVSMDGRIRVWHYDTIDQADPPDDDRVVTLEPIFDFQTPNVQFMCIEKRSRNPKDTFYYAQDGNGGIWKIDLTTEINVTPSEQLYKSHAGAVADIASCPWGPYFVSLGIDGRLHLYNYLETKLLFSKEFPAKGTCMMWMPVQTEPSGDILILGFDDGCLRVIQLEIQEASNLYEVTIIQLTKPHNKALTCMSVNYHGNILVTSGKDITIFVYMIKSHEINQHMKLIPIGYVRTSDMVTCMTWHNTEETTIILGCDHGYIDIVTLPKQPQDYTKITYVLQVDSIKQRFITYKSQIRRDIKLREIEAKKAVKRAKKKKELEEYKKENPGLEIDEEIFLADSESTETLESLFIPEVPNKILWVQHTIDGTLWLSMGEFDAGYIYEYFIGQKEEVPCKFTMIHEADDVEISSYVYNYNRKYLIFAMQNGAIRVNRVKDNFRDLSDYWQLSMHDNYNGFVPKMCFSYDEKYLFTCGSDGNVFSYKYNPEDDDYLRPPHQAHHRGVYKEYEFIDDQNTYTLLSLEETIVKAEEDRKTKLANDHKAEYLETIHELKKEFLNILKKNKKLLPTQIIPRDKFELDPRITKNLNDILESNLALVRRKLAYAVEKSEIRINKLKKHFIDPLDLFDITVAGVRKTIKVTTLRQQRLPDGFFEIQQWVEDAIVAQEIQGRAIERAPIYIPEKLSAKEKKKELEYFLMGLSPSTIEKRLNDKLSRLLRKYRMRKVKLDRRQHEWDIFNATKPVEGVNHPDDEAAMVIAIKSIGDYKLKSAVDYKVPIHLRESTLKKYRTLLQIRKKQFDVRHNFNQKIHDLRKKKVNLRENLHTMEKLLYDIHNEIPPDKHVFGPEVIKLKDEDFPEKNLELILNLPPEMQPPIEKIQIIIPEPTGDLLEKEVLPCVEYGVPLEEGEVISNWEQELKRIRLKRKLYQQQQTIAGMENAISEFDRAVENAQNERLQVVVDAKFLDLYLLTLNQELLILKKFEAGENKLTDEIKVLTEETLDIQDILIKMNNKIESHKHAIEGLEEFSKIIQRKFFDAASDSKFFDFLRRIFKKKYKPPKAKDADDDESDSESSSSSSSSDDDEEAGSIDSRDVGPIRLDDSVCPKGCDQTLYDLTFSLRTERHLVEQAIKDNNTAIEGIKKEIEHVNKKYKLAEGQLNRVQDELEAYQREKQKNLNQIICTVVLKIHQLQHLISDNQLNNIKDTLVFSKQVLLRLYKRVGQLENETLQQRSKHAKNIRHLGRMKTDCKYMEQTILQLYEEINEKMRNKFGKIVDIDEVQEACLKRMVFDMRMSMLDIRSMYEDEMRLWRDRYMHKQRELAQVIKDNTSKLEILALLNSEKTELMKILNTQDEKRSHFKVLSDAKLETRTDLLKLGEVVSAQRQELKLLRDEIQTLKTKGLQRKKETPLAIEEEVEEEELEMMELDETDEVIQVEFPHTVVPQPHFNIIPPSSESHAIAKDILTEFFEELDLDVNARTTAEEAIEQILKQVSITALIESLLKLIPRELSDVEQDILEVTAEKLYALKEDQEEEEEEDDTEPKYAKETLDAIIDRTVLTVEATHDIANMLKNLVEEVPLTYILEESSITRILAKIVNSATAIDKDELIKKCLSITSTQRKQMEKILQIILEQVYGLGIDYLYFIDI